MKLLITALLFFIPLLGHAAWTNTSGKVTLVSTYTTTEHILFTLDNNNITVPENCTTSTFAIEPHISADKRSQLLSVLLAAQASGKTVNIAYDDTLCTPWTSGSTQYLKVYRIGILN